MTGSGVRWGRYEGLRVVYDESVPNVIPERIEGPLLERLSQVNQAYAIAYRDRLIAEVLMELGVQRNLDIGCDFGSLVATLSHFGIKSSGIDPAAEAVQAARASGLDVTYGSIEELLESEEGHLAAFCNGEGLASVSCLNIAHVRWADEQARWSFLKALVRHADFTIVTLTSGDVKRLSRVTGCRVVTRLSNRLGSYSKARATLEQYGYRAFGNPLLDAVLRSASRLKPNRVLFPDKIRPYASLVVVLSKSIG